MSTHSLLSISPVDGRYRDKVEELAEYFSEYALIKYRILVEIEYFIALCEIPLPQLSRIDKSVYPELRKLYKEFTKDEAVVVKNIERRTNHDIKAIEYFIREKFTDLGLADYREFIHFGLTSQDINNTAIPYSFRDAVNEIYYPLLDEALFKLSEMGKEWEEIPMLARTHGQPASPTRLGKEVRVFVERLSKQLLLLKSIPCSAKFGGATGNFNAHHVAYPEIDWVEFGNSFVNDTLGLDRTQTTTQIEHYDNLAAIFDNLKRINTVLIDLARDIWMYISMEYFRQKIIKGEVSSSTMPHKVNPIDFENAEGNFGFANSIFEHLAAKLPVSRLQRDLTDSTVLRNIGVPMAHTMIGLKSMKKGLDKLIVNPEKIGKELEENWSVIAEAIQTILRREGYPDPYEKLKELTRVNRSLSRPVIHQFIDSLEISEKIKSELKNITPGNYVGI
ncbi:MAG: adenylosuccinate lyase [Bacteroidales bacterium]|nr:MAG: adenylosuccinate lyase [Bacteroidales bacterium]